MAKILITGATDGIGLETAKKLSTDGHEVLIHGRSPAKIEEASRLIGKVAGSYQADLSNLESVKKLAEEIKSAHDHIDVLINNAGVYKTPHSQLENGQDVRFVVNIIAPYVLTLDLLPALSSESRIVNLSSAAQADVEIDALHGKKALADFEAYAQSKFAISLWSYQMAQNTEIEPFVVSLNPGSLLATKMVREGFGASGNDINIGRDILIEAALGESFLAHNGDYFDNDGRGFISMAQHAERANLLVEELEKFRI